ncbi:hypothetical protein [Marinilabilia salmonicolor]|uniref:hypothetical protein n=1 Tax=Marinilabilia salmonicolor TaxID=989 RepID=UPI000299F3EE|nr:hypothetical protein [Marinilabilia salmonicolor]
MELNSWFELIIYILLTAGISFLTAYAKGAANNVHVKSLQTDLKEVSHKLDNELEKNKSDYYVNAERKRKVFEDGKFALYEFNRIIMEWFYSNLIWDLGEILDFDTDFNGHKYLDFHKTTMIELTKQKSIIELVVPIDKSFSDEFRGVLNEIYDVMVKVLSATAEDWIDLSKKRENILSSFSGPRLEQEKEKFSRIAQQTIDKWQEKHKKVFPLHEKFITAVNDYLNKH